MNDKPITMIIDETKEKLVSVCNESNLPLFILDLVLQGVYSEVHQIVEIESLKEREIYNKSLEQKADIKKKDE